MVMLVRREQWTNFLKVAKQLIEEYFFMLKMLIWFAMEKSFCFKIFSIKIYREANHMSQLNNLHN